MNSTSLDTLVRKGMQSLAIICSLSSSSPVYADDLRYQTKGASVNLFPSDYSLPGQPERPPYLDPAPGQEAPRYQESDVSSTKKKSSDYTYGTIFTLVGAAVFAFGTQKMTICVNGECESGIPPAGYAIMISGGLIAINGIYLLSR